MSSEAPPSREAGVIRLASSSQANQKNMDLFWRFIVERQSVWHRRFVQRLPAPWTADPILRTFKFTNVYRELDKGTVFYLSDVVGNIPGMAMYVNTENRTRDYIFRTLVYRIFNQISTWQALDDAGLCWTNLWDHEKAWAVLYKINRTKGQNVFTNAHIVSPYNSTPGDSKAEKVCHICTDWATHIGSITTAILAQPSLKRVFQYLTTLHGLGPFLAYEVCIDLMYGKIIPFSEDDWANAGPGAMRGANLIFPNRRDYIQIMRELRNGQRDHLARLGLLDTWAAVAYPDRPFLSLRGIEHSLCEFQKYFRAYEGVGRPRNTFKPTSQGDEDWMEALKG